MSFPPLETFSAVLRLGRELLSTESKLLRAELREARGGLIVAVLIGASAALFWLAVIGAAAFAAGAWLIHYGFDTHIAATSVAGALLAISLLLTVIAIVKFRRVSIYPQRTVRQVKKDLSLLENVVHGQ